MQITKEDVNALREFSGEGLMSCKSALVKAEGDIRLAAGYLKAQGCLIYTENREAWERSYAKSWIKDLVYENGKLGWATK